MLETIKAAQPGWPAPWRCAEPAPAAIDWPVAASVLRLIQQRLARLSAPALRLARCAAVAGQDLNSALAASVLGQRLIDLADAWSELEAAQVLRDGGFAHDLIAEAALASVPQAVARPLHAEVAAWLEAHDGAPARVAEHWLAAGETRRAAPQRWPRRSMRWAVAARSGGPPVRRRSATSCRPPDAAARPSTVYFRAAEAMSEYRIDEQVEHWAAQLTRWPKTTPSAPRRSPARGAAGGEAPLRRRAPRGRAQAWRWRATRAPRTSRSNCCGTLTALDWERRERRCRRRTPRRAALRRLADVVPGTARLDLRDTHFKLLHALGAILSCSAADAEGDRRLEEAIVVASQRRGTPWALGIAASLTCNAIEQAMARGRSAGWHGRWPTTTATRSMPTRAPTRWSPARPSTPAAATWGRRWPTWNAPWSCARGLVRSDVAALARQATLHFELGCRDLALKGLRRCWPRVVTCMA